MVTGAKTSACQVPGRSFLLKSSYYTEVLEPELLALPRERSFSLPIQNAGFCHNPMHSPQTRWSCGLPTLHEILESCLNSSYCGNNCCKEAYFTQKTSYMLWKGMNCTGLKDENPIKSSWIVPFKKASKRLQVTLLSLTNLVVS